MKIAYVFFNGELEGRVEYFKDLLLKEKGDIYCACLLYTSDAADD